MINFLQTYVGSSILSKKRQYYCQLFGRKLFKYHNTGPWPKERITQQKVNQLGSRRPDELAKNRSKCVPT
jgi:hypothetical protein